MALLDFSQFADPGITSIPLPGMPETPEEQPPAKKKGGGWVDWLTSVNEGSPGMQALKLLLLNMPFGASVSRRGPIQTPSMSAGQVLGPMIQQKQNAAQWEAFKKAGLIPEGVGAPLQAAGMPVAHAFPLLREIARQKGTEEQERRNAQTLKEQAVRMGFPEIAQGIGDRVGHEDYSRLWQEMNARLREKGEEKKATQREVLEEKKSTERQSLEQQREDARAAAQQRQFGQQMAMQGRMFGQQMKMESIRAEHAEARQRASQAEMDERSRRGEIVKSYGDEASRYTGLLTESKSNRDKRIRGLEESVSMGLAKPQDVAAQRVKIEQDYAADIAPLEDARDTARLYQRASAAPPPAKRVPLTADQLAAELTRTKHDPEYQKRLLRDVEKDLEKGAIDGLVPEEFITLRRQWKQGQ
jgi:hypothetical protein